MPLSEHEQHLLEQMERALYADDPKLASTLRGSRGAGHSRRRLVIGVVGLLAGIGLLIAGVSSDQAALPLGVLGFLVMLGSAWFASSGWQAKGAAKAQPSAPAQPGQPAASPAKAPRSSFMRRIEERWDRRRDERGR
jgi:hypothetical protein